MARWCIDFQSGHALHFPAGTYREQVADEWGVIELERMNLMRRLWRTFVAGDASTWEPGSDEMDLAAWLANEPIDDTRLNEWIGRQWSENGG